MRVSSAVSSSSSGKNSASNNAEEQVQYVLRADDRNRSMHMSKSFMTKLNRIVLADFLGFWITVFWRESAENWNRKTIVFGRREYNLQKIICFRVKKLFEFSIEKTSHNNNLCFYLTLLFQDTFFKYFVEKAQYDLWLSDKELDHKDLVLMSGSDATEKELVKKEKKLERYNDIAKNLNIFINSESSKGLYQ